MTYLKFVEPTLKLKKILIRNLSREKVDALFARKEYIVNQISNLRRDIEYSNDKSHINALQNRINKLMEQQQQFDSKAREIDRKIIEFVKNLKE